MHYQTVQSSDIDDTIEISQDEVDAAIVKCFTCDDVGARPDVNSFPDKNETMTNMSIRKCGSIHQVNIKKSHTLSINFANVLELVRSYFVCPKIPDLDVDNASASKMSVSISMDTEADAVKMRRQIGETILNCLVGQMEWNDVKTLLPFRKSPSEFELTLKEFLAKNQSEKWR